MKYYRVVLARTAAGRTTKFSVDFGYCLTDQRMESVRKIRAQYPECKLISTFVIPPDEAFNGLTAKLPPNKVRK